MQRHDEHYFEQRAEEEQELAERAKSPAATEAHRRLARLYTERAHPEPAADGVAG